MVDKFTREALVLTAPTKPKGGGELQLGSMVALTNKTSSQSFFLRVLKVIIQLREAALLAIKKAQKARKEAEFKRKTEAEIAAKEVEIAAKLVGKEAKEAAKEDATKDPATTEEVSTSPDMEVSANMTSQAPTSTSTSPMEVESPLSMPDSLESLSEQLCLSDLWSTLSNCPWPAMLSGTNQTCV